MFSPAEPLSEAAIDLLASARGKKFGTILADPPWQFQNRTGKVAPEHKRLNRYGTMTLDEICALPVEDIAAALFLLWGGSSARVSEGERRQDRLRLISRRARSSPAKPAWWRC